MLVSVVVYDSYALPTTKNRSHLSCVMWCCVVLCCVVLCCVVIICQVVCIANQTTEAITCSFNLQMEPIANHNLSMIVFRHYYLLCTLLRLSIPPPREPTGRVPAPISQTNLSQCPPLSPLSYLSLITGSVEAFAIVRFHKTT